MLYLDYCRLCDRVDAQTLARLRFDLFVPQACRSLSQLHLHSDNSLGNYRVHYWFAFAEDACKEHSQGSFAAAKKCDIKNGGTI